jgi:uncharacterized protein
MVQNRVGRPVTGENFFGREEEQRRCWECLESDHLLLLAPRRVGKTSLMLRLRSEARANGFEASYMSGAEAEDEAGFVQRLYDAVEDLGVSPGIWQRLVDGPFGRWVRSIEKVEVAGVGLELTGADREQWAAAGEKLARALDQQESPCLLLVDEVPVFVLKLLHLDTSGERARRFLTWFRALRQRSDLNGSLRWLLAGSIGLDTVAARLNLGDTINDLHLFHLGPFSHEVADALLSELSATHQLPLPQEVRAHILRRVGWTIPYYLQIVFSELREQHGANGAPPPTLDHVDGIFENLMKPAKKAYFDYWRQRLDEELGRPDARLAIHLLNAISLDAQGVSRQTLRQHMGKQIRSSEPRDEKLRFLLDVLEGDGYIAEQDGRFLFRSPLVREFWSRRVAS